MAIADDSNVPLLSNHPILPNEPTIHHNYNHNNLSSTNLESNKNEQYIEENSGTYRQLIRAFIIALACAFDAQQCFITIFTDATTSTTTTTITEWDLETSSSFIRGLPTSAFFIGSVAGGFLLSTLADSVLGRKKLLLLCTLTMSISSLLAAFSPNVLVYSTLRFLCGFGRAPIVTCALVLVAELVKGKRKRGPVGINGFVFAIGFLSLSPIAYLNRHTSWRDIYLWTSVPGLLYCIVVYIFVQESPRWRLLRELEEEEAAITIEGGISDAPHGSDEEQGGGAGTEGYHDNNNHNANNGNDDKNNNGSDVKSLYSAMRILVSRDWSLRRILAVTIICFGMGLIYYGMPLGLSNLPVNLYISVAINAIAELPPALIMFLFVAKMDRRRWLLAASLVSGACSVLVAAAAQFDGSLAAVQVGLELISFSSGVMAINLGMILTTELFPTCARSSALAIARQALVMGGACGPFLVAAGTKNEFLSYGVFGGVMVFCGLFSLSLPETRGTVLCDTMDEEEKKMLERVVN